jgi:hypothetical protein
MSLEVALRDAFPVAEELPAYFIEHKRNITYLTSASETNSLVT